MNMLWEKTTVATATANRYSGLERFQRIGDGNVMRCVCGLARADYLHRSVIDDVAQEIWI